MQMIEIPVWAVWLLLVVLFQLLAALLCRRALGSFRLAVRDIGSAVQAYVGRSEKLYLVGRVRHAAGSKTLWDVMGVVASEARAEAACTLKNDFYLRLDLGQIQDDEDYRPAPVVFPKGKDKG